MKARLFSLLFLCFLLMSSYFEFTPPQSGIIDLGNLFNYVIEDLPARAEYRHNEKNPVSDKGATLGRVLFYDKKLSVNNTTACASCHQQAHAFGDPRKVSIGFNGAPTQRHAMRLVNVDFHVDNNRFWDERVTSLENVTTLPFHNKIEMGFSGEDGFPGIDSLISRMREIDYYQQLFQEVYGTTIITERRMALALAQFIRSINTFDTKFDEGFNIVGDEIGNFPNFTEAENKGKRLFFNPPIGIFDGEVSEFFGKGAACGFCHKAPGFDLIHIAQNNGVIGVAGDSTAIDLSVKRAPSLKNLVKPDGTPNGPFMHDGSLATLEAVVDHYNFIPLDTRNTSLDGLLFPLDNGNVELRLTDEEKSNLIAFLKTLSGPDLYTNEKWANPFDENGQLQLLNCATCEVQDTINSEQEETNTSNETDIVFQLFPWLLDVINLEDCAGTTISVYEQGSYQFVFVQTLENTTMYFQDGSFYCQNSPNYSCKEAYNLEALTFEWNCTTESNFQALPIANSRNIRRTSNLLIFPNPNNGSFQIILPPFQQTSVDLQLIDLSGKILHKATLNEQALTSPYAINLSTIAEGLYFLRIQAGTESYSKKVFVKKQ